MPCRRASPPRSGFARRPLLAMAGSLALLAVLAYGLYDRPPAPANSAGDNSANQPLVIYCAASNKSVLEAIRADYEKEFGTPLQIQYGP